MQLGRKGHRERLLITGSILLLILGAGVFFTGRIINRKADQMSRNIVSQVGESHHNLLSLEFDKTEQMLAIARDFTHEHPSPSDSELRLFATTLLGADPKISRVWLLENDGRTLHAFRRGGEARRTLCDTSDLPLRAAREMGADSLWSRTVRQDTVLLWSLAQQVSDRQGGTCICGIDLPLLTLYAHIATQNPFSRSYATIIDNQGLVVYHPDSTMLGRQVVSPAYMASLRDIAPGSRGLQLPLPEYLGMAEERICYPMQIDKQAWVMVVSIPQFSIEQEIEDFHLYTILTAVLSMVVFGVLLILSQRRWRREYDLRRLSERESAQLHLQQVLEQIDPHFLFNSLNSLYALIRRSPEQAREFTLTLSRVYRHVLERRHEILSSVSDEIDFTWQYYSLQKIRFGDRILLTTRIDPSMRSHCIPSMSLQTLVENAVKHNRITDLNPLHIQIRTEPGQLVIENNLTLRGDAESLGVGLERIRSVYRFYTHDNIRISTGDGYFRCSLPLLPPQKH